MSQTLPLPPPPNQFNQMNIKYPLLPPQKKQRFLPDISILPIRGKDREFLKFRKPFAYLEIGQKESGKSSLLEAIGCRYPKVIDIFGSRDSEGLGWCRSHLKDSILFVTGDNIDVKSQWDTKTISDLKISDIAKYKVVLSVSAFHSSIDAEFQCMNQMINILYRRTHWTEPWYIGVREAANFIYSRLKVSNNQTIAKADFLYLMREGRHMGYAMGVDTIRWTGIDADARGVSDYICIKRVGTTGLPQDLHFLYAYIIPSSFMNMSERTFVLVSSRGPLALGVFDYPWWHKKEKEDIVKLLDINIEYGDVPDYGDQARNWVSDFEHIKLVATYQEVRSMNKVAKQFGRSPATVNSHIRAHDEDVKKNGYCLQCKRVRGPHQNVLLVKRNVVYSEPYTSFEAFLKTFDR